MGRALMESILFLNGTGIASYIRRDVMDFYGVGPKDLEGIVSQLRVTEGVEVAVFMYELKQNEFKVSLRSNEKILAAAGIRRHPDLQWREHRLMC